MKHDSVKKTIIVATLLCIVCSIFVSGAAVLLKSRQEENKSLDTKKNMLLIAKLIDENNATKENILSAYSKVRPQVIEIETGMVAKNIDSESFDQRKAAKDPKFNTAIVRSKDIAGIKFRSKYAKVFYVVEDGDIKSVILPVHGKGLWSTMYGFIALDKDTKTIKGIGFYDHGETPGLGGEVDNKKWKSSWIGKELYDNAFNVLFSVVKGQANPKSNKFNHEVDGLSGATLTSNGVQELVRYWLGEDGFSNFLKRFRNEGAGL